MNDIERGSQTNSIPEEPKKTKYFSTFAMENIYPFRRIFNEGGVLGHGEGNPEWRNVSEHSLVVGTVADILAEGLSADRKVTKAAILHDWYKRREVESKAAEGADYWATTERDTQALKKLLIEKAGLSEGEAEEMVELSHANFPKKDWVRQQPDGSLVANPDRTAEEKIMHLVDEIVMGTDIVPFQERIGQQAKKERGRKYYDSFQTYFGVPLDQVHLVLCENDQREFEKRLGLENGTLIEFVKNKLVDRIEQAE